MKKLLLGTTALIGAAAIASVASAAAPAPEALTVTVGGYMQFDAGFSSEDEDAGQDLRGHDFRTSTEVHVKAEGTTDNGLTYGTVIELEGDQNTTNNGDNNFIYVSGGWGKFELGDNDGVADSGSLSITAPGDWGMGGVVADDESYRDFIQNTRTIMTDGSLGSDLAFMASLYESLNTGSSTKITYYTPVWNGFQAGLSYAPEIGNNGTSTNTDDDDGAAAGDDYDMEISNAWEFAAKYAYDFGNDVGVGASLAYVHGSSQNNAGTDIVEDLRSWTFGANVTWGGFTLGGSWTDAGDSLATVTNSVIAGFDDTQAYAVGLQYETGPFVFGVNHMASSAESDDATADADAAHFDATSVGVTYAAAPGWIAYAEATQFDLEDEADATITNDNDGSVVVLGTRVSF